MTIPKPSQRCLTIGSMAIRGKEMFSDDKFEKQMNVVLKHQDDALKSIHFSSADAGNTTIAETEALLRSFGYSPKVLQKPHPVPQAKKVMIIPTWEELCEEAARHVGTDCALESIFTEEELRDNDLAVRQLRGEFDAIHRLDTMDVVISALAGIIGATVDILLVGIPKKSADGLKARPLAD